MSESLFHEPYKFDFFQAVRLLERDSPGLPVGLDSPPAHEAARFHSHISNTFSPNEVASIETDHDGPPAVGVSFMGLVGPNSALPPHYTTLILERLRRRDSTLRDFLDLFNHRLISQLYRAWEKNHFAFAYERQSREQTPDLFTECLYCLVGRGTAGMRGRRTVSDEAYLYYAGQFAQGVRSAATMQMVLADYTGLPLEIEELVGQWLYLGDENQSYLATADNEADCNAQLGVDVVLGERVWDIQSKFQIRVGPMRYADFHRYTPTQAKLAEVVELARSLAGPEFDFDIQLVLQADDVPRCVLGDASEQSPRLGWNTWIQSQTGEHDADDAVFSTEAI